MLDSSRLPATDVSCDGFIIANCLAGLSSSQSGFRLAGASKEAYFPGYLLSHLYTCSARNANARETAYRLRSSILATAMGRRWWFTKSPRSTISRISEEADCRTQSLFNQKLLVVKALKDHGVQPDEVKILEMAPPDMPAALFSKAVDAITSRQPYMGQAELDGYGRVLYQTKDVWPNFISCVLAVREDAIRDHRETVQKLVDGIAKSGRWLDQTMDHRMEPSRFLSASTIITRTRRLLRFVLSKPPDRVKYTNLALGRMIS